MKKSDASSTELVPTTPNSANKKCRQSEIEKIDEQIEDMKLQ